MFMVESAAKAPRNSLPTKPQHPHGLRRFAPLFVRPMTLFADHGHAATGENGRQIQGVLAILRPCAWKADRCWKWMMFGEKQQLKSMAVYEIIEIRLKSSLKYRRLLVADLPL